MKVTAGNSLLLLGHILILLGGIYLLTGQVRAPPKLPPPLSTHTHSIYLPAPQEQT